MELFGVYTLGHGRICDGVVKFRNSLFMIFYAVVHQTLLCFFFEEEEIGSMILTSIQGHQIETGFRCLYRTYHNEFGTSGTHLMFVSE
jgi:hypothetical protein